MKRFLLFCLTIIAALSMRASVVSFDFSSQTSLTELGLTIPSSARPSTVFPDSISYQGITMTNNSSLNQIRLENGSDMVYSFRMYSQTRVVISSATPITAIQVEWYSSAYGNNIAELTDGAWYGSSYSVTLNAYLGDNYISKITVTTEDATGTDPTGTGTTPETGSAIQVGDFYYEIQDYGYGAFAELVRVPGTTGYASYTNLSGDITIPGSITYNGTSYQVRAIEYQALNGSGISSVTVEEGVEYIYNFAFMDCSSLTTVTLPSTISYMGNQVFGWSGLKTLTINATTPPIHGEREYCLMDASYVEHIYVPASSVAAYKADTVWANHASIIEAIPSGTTTDPTTPVTEPTVVTWDSINGLTTIDISQYTNYNFGGKIETFNDPNFVSKEIEGVTASVSATVDGSYARVLTYEGNTSISVSGGGTLTFNSPELPIQSIVINFDPDKGVVNVNSASDWTVTAGDATSIQVSQVIWSGTPTYSVVLEDAYISHITSIVFTFASGTGTDPGTGTTPETGSIIQVGDFYYEIKDYGDGLYAELVKVPGSDEFASYTNLSGDITIPGSITYGGADYPVSGVGYMSLTGSSAITSVTIGEGVGYIHNFAFMNCSSLTTATLPSTVTSMGNQVFGWSGLKTITINAITPPYVMSDEDPFKDASYVEHIYVPASSVDAYKAASVWSNHASIIEAIPSGTTADPTTTADYTIILYQPDACPDMKPAVIGSFTNWEEAVPMEAGYDKDRNLYYTYTFQSEEEPMFKIKEVQDSTWTNEILFYAEYETGGGEWLSMDGIGFEGENSIILDWRDNTKYRYAQCETTTDTVVDCSHTYYFADTVCSNEEAYYMDDRVVFYSGRIDTIRYGENSYTLRRNEEHQTFSDTIRTADGCEDIYMYDICWKPSSLYVGYYRMEEGEMVNFGGRNITNSGIYLDTILNSYGCDSISEWHVTFYRMTYDTINAAICQGEVYEFRGNAWSRAGSYRTTSAQGDTTFIINLTVYPTRYTDEFWPIYEGNPIVIGDRRYEQPGRYDDTLKSIMGCDSIIRVYIENARYHIDLSSNNYDFGRVRGDTMVVWPDSTATFQAVPYDGYVFSKWSDGNTENPRTVTVQQDMAFTAIFKPFKYTITVVAEDPTMGTVMGGGTYLPNEQVTIMATPYKDCEFVQWSDGNKLNPRSFRAQGDSVYTAVFHRELPPEPVICSDTMFFTSADTALLATRVYAASEIEPYDKLIIATVDNKNVMGPQFVEGFEVRNFRTAVEYTEKMNISNVSIVEVVPNNGNYRLRVADGQLAPRCEDCTSSTNQLYATEIGADWYFAEYDSVVVPEALGYDNRMILYNDESMRFSSYRQLTSVDRRQTTVFKLHTKRDIPVEPVIIVEDTTAWQEEEPAMDSIQVEVVPQDTVAVISTPHVDYVYSFTLIIWADEAHTEVLLIITYDAEGTQISVTRPSAVRRLPAISTDITFQINELKPSQTYHYTLVACEDDGSILTSLNSSFMTTSEPTPMGINSLLDSQDETVKLIYNGQLFILRNGKWYNALGVQVK